MKRFIVALLIVLFMQSVCLAQWAELMAVSKKKGGGGATDYTQDANCMGAWYMNVNNGTELDRSGNSEDLAETGGSMPTSSDVPAGYSGTSRDFEDDETEWLLHADGGSTDISGANQPISFCFWLKQESVINNDRYIAKWGNSDQYVSMYYNSSMHFVISIDGSSQAGNANSATNPGADSNFHHWAFVYNDIDMRIYVDGVLDSNGANNPGAYTSGIFDGTENFTVGYGSGANYTDGLLDEVAIFDRALSAEEVAEIYATGIDGTKGGND